MATVDERRGVDCDNVLSAEGVRWNTDAEFPVAVTILVRTLLDAEARCRAQVARRVWRCQLTEKKSRKREDE